MKLNFYDIGIQPMILANHLGIPIFDGDLMGRAYPCVWLSASLSCSTKAVSLEKKYVAG